MMMRYQFVLAERRDGHSMDNTSNLDPNYGLQGRKLSFAVFVGVPIFVIVITVGLLWSILAAPKQTDTDCKPLLLNT